MVALYLAQWDDWVRMEPLLGFFRRALSWPRAVTFSPHSALRSSCSSFTLRVGRPARHQSSWPRHVFGARDRLAVVALNPTTRGVGAEAVGEPVTVALANHSPSWALSPVASCGARQIFGPICFDQSKGQNPQFCGQGLMCVGNHRGRRLRRRKASCFLRGEASLGWPCSPCR